MRPVAFAVLVLVALLHSLSVSVFAQPALQHDVAKAKEVKRHKFGKPRLFNKPKPHSPLSNHVPEMELKQLSNGERLRRGLPPAPPPKFVGRTFGKGQKRETPTKQLQPRGSGLPRRRAEA